MDEWMSRWMVGWMGGCMDEWTGRLTVENPGLSFLLTGSEVGSLVLLGHTVVYFKAQSCSVSCLS